jgi:hypothetical protein
MEWCLDACLNQIMELDSFGVSFFMIILLGFFSPFSFFFLLLFRRYLLFKIVFIFLFVCYCYTLNFCVLQKFIC